jgi:hypothetical protein
MVLGDIADVRAIAGNATVDEISDGKVTEYLQASTVWVQNKTGVLEADWAAHEDFKLAVMASENYAAAFVVLVVSTVKDKTDRHRELLSAAKEAMSSIIEGASEVGTEDPYFIDMTSDYKTYENNPEGVEPYKSFL